MTVPVGSEEEMACIELVELVTAYLDDRLSPADQRRFDGHLADCGPCRSYMQQFRSTIELTGRLGVEDVPAGDRAAALEAFRGWRGDELA